MTEVKKQAGQLDLNIAFYIQIYRKCLEEAEKIGREKNYKNEEVFGITEAIFRQFFLDQTAIAGQARQVEATVNGLHAVMESRGR